MKNILILHSSNDLYGASKALIKTINCLNKNQFKIHLILPSSGKLDNELINKVYKLNYYNLGVFRKKYLNFLGLFDRFFKIIDSSLYVRNYIKKNKIDLVYTNTSVIWAGSIASFSLKKKNIVHIHEIPFGNNLYNVISGIFFKLFTDSVIVVSKKVKDHWKKNIDIKKMKIIYNYSEFEIKERQFEYLKKGTREYTITNISRIVPQKGIEYFIKIASELLKKNKELKFNIVGDHLSHSDNYLNNLKKILKNNNLEKHILFKGFIKDIKKVILNSDMILQTPVKPDSLPTVLIDSLTLNKPVVSTNIGGSSEILNCGKNGLLISTKNPKKSAKLIYEYIKNLNLQKQHLVNSASFLEENFSQSEFETNILITISKLLNE